MIPLSGTNISSCGISSKLVLGIDNDISFIPDVMVIPCQLILQEIGGVISFMSKVMVILP